jgi:ribose 5-phosphate isomerase A
LTKADRVLSHGLQSAAGGEAEARLADLDQMKRQAAAAALELVEPGMRLGLGTGSTAAWFVRLLAERVASGLDIVAVPTSEQTATLAAQLSIPIVMLEDVDGLDLTVDGADEIDAAMNLIKGGGGALLREKIVARDSAKFVVIADVGKRTETLGRFPLPLEVVSFGYAATLRAISAAASSVGLSGLLARRTAPDGSVYLTDQGNWIVDASFRQISNPRALATALSDVPGLVEHGLFIDMASTIILSDGTGAVRIDRA